MGEKGSKLRGEDQIDYAVNDSSPKVVSQGARKRRSVERSLHQCSKCGCLFNGVTKHDHRFHDGVCRQCSTFGEKRLNGMAIWPVSPESA